MKDERKAFWIIYLCKSVAMNTKTRLFFKRLINKQIFFLVNFAF